MPSGFNKAMGLWFLFVNFAALLLFVGGPEQKPVWRVLFFVGVVPVEIASFFLAVYVCGAFGFECQR